jgi:RNA polymerase subunit RPABC4/transcription elongation factor Spt4
MTMSRKPLPLYVAPHRKRCPVCGETSYSLGGMHPQCCVRQADAERIRRLKLAVPVVAAVPPKDRPPWKKPCPRCQRLLHVRRAACDCGYRFTAALRAAE